MSYTSNRKIWLHLPGTLLFGTGVLHTAFGLTTPALRDPLIDMLRDGLLATVELVPDLPLADRSTSFWYVSTGALMCVAGAALRACSLATLRGGEGSSSGPDGYFGVPADIGWTLVGVGAVGAVCVPWSGFWVVLAEGLYILWVVNSNKRIGGGGSGISGSGGSGIGSAGASPAGRKGKAMKSYDPNDF